MTYLPLTGAGIAPAAATITPTSYSGLQFWYKADAGITSSGGKVSAWADQSGNSITQSQATGTKQPSIVASVQNGLPAVQFTSANSTFMTDGGTMASMTTDLTVFGIINATSFASFPQVVTQGNGDTDGFNLFVSTGTSPANQPAQIELVSPGTWGTDYKPYGTAISTATWYVLTGRRTASTGETAIFLNGTKQATTTTDTGSITYNTGYHLFLGAKNVAATDSFWNGYIGEVFGYNAALTDTQVSNLVTYARNRWSF